MAVVVDYSTHFWGEKHIGYHVLYENLKRGEDAVQELGTFVKERMGIEDDLLKFFHKSLNRVSNYAVGNGAFNDSWRLTKGTLELWAEIQTSLLKNLTDLSKDIIRYHDELVKSRKRAKEYDVLDAVNLMQTTTTCLQKAKETYLQRCSEVMNLKSEMTNAKEFLKAKNKLYKAHEEYKAYVEKYNQVRETFEEKMLKATLLFQSHDQAHLLQMKKFFTLYARNLDDSHNSISQMISNYRRNLEELDITQLMHRFVMEKSTGLEKPQSIIWTEADEIPAEIEIFAASLTNNTTTSTPAAQSAPSSSNSSAVVGNSSELTTVNDLLGIDDTWTSYGQNCHGGFDSKSGDSDSDCGIGGPAVTSNHSSYVPQFSSWLGRQKITQWRKKHSASQSNLPAVTLGETNSSTTSNEFSTAFTDTPNSGGQAFAGTASSAPSKGNFLRRYRKSKNSINDLTLMSENKDYLPTSEDNRSTASSSKSEEKPTSSGLRNSFANSSTSASTATFADGDTTETNFGSFLPPPIPSTDPPPLSSVIGRDRRVSIASSSMDDQNGLTPTTGGFGNSSDNFSNGLFGESLTKNSHPLSSTEKVKDYWNNSNNDSSSSSSEDETEFQTSKIRTLQIKPINESNSKINTSVDELRNAIGYMSLQRSSTFDKDPWASVGDQSTNFTQSLNTNLKPIRAALTGDEHLRRKFSEFDTMLPLGNVGFGAGSSIARARPRSHTPTAQLMQPSTSASTITSNSGGSSFQNSFVFGTSFDDNTAQLASQMVIGNANGSLSSLSNIAMPLNNESTFSGSSSVSPINFMGAMSITPNTQQQQQQQQQHNRQKLPIAMALNEYIHVWFKGEDTKTSIMRVFGTVMISFPIAILTHLCDTKREVAPLKFTLKNASQIKSILPNQRLVQANSTFQFPSSSSYSFCIERKTLVDWLLEQQKAKPTNSFHNVDIARYELSDGVGDSTFAPPLYFTAYWRTEPAQTNLRIDYRLNTTTGFTTQNPLLNIVFTTTINGKVANFNSDPEAKWSEETGAVTWTLTELSKHGDCSGSLKARLKLMDGPASIPANTSVQFQASDNTISKLSIGLDDGDEHYALSMSHPPLNYLSSTKQYVPTISCYVRAPKES